MTMVPENIANGKRAMEEIEKYINGEKEDIELIKEDEGIVQAEDFFSVMEEDLAEFEEKSWNKGDGYSDRKSVV